MGSSNLHLQNEEIQRSISISSRFPEGDSKINHKNEKNNVRATTSSSPNRPVLTSPSFQSHEFLFIFHAMKPKCVFYSRDKFCAKGAACEYFHDDGSSPRLPCKNFGTSAGCKFGDACRFEHVRRSANNRINAPPSTAAASVPNRVASVSSSTTATNKKKTNNTSSTSNSSSSSSSSDISAPGNSEKLNAWGFIDDNVYFYGAPGTFSAPEHKKSYANITGSDSELAEMNNKMAIMEIASEPSNSKICPFYVSSGCKFGSRCRYLHPALLSDSDAAGDRAPPNSECGICMGSPENGTYGLLNNCNCVFCLDCIRGWRSEGLAIVHENSQVRYAVCVDVRLPE
jgi:hypothetical protein